MSAMWGTCRYFISCFGKALSADLRMMLDTKVPRSPVSDLRLPLREFRVVISFVVTHEGKIEEVAFEEGNRQFRDQALEAMNSLVNFMEVTNIRIQPALDLEDMPVGMRFHAPIVLTNPNPRGY